MKWMPDLLEHAFWIGQSEAKLKNKIAAGIMLLAGSIAVITCFIKKSSLETMLIATFVSMFVFMIIGFIVQNLFQKLNEAAERRLREEAERIKMEEARLQAEIEETKRLERERLEQEEAEEQTQSAKKKELDEISDVLASGISAKYEAANAEGKNANKKQ